MIEILGIILSLIVFISFSLFPLNIKSYQKIFYVQNNFMYDFLFLNLLINFVMMFLISFTNLNFFYYFFFIITFSLIFNVINYFKNTNFKFKTFKKLNFLLFIFFNLILFVYIAKNPTLSWDGVENWYYKAQNFFYNDNFFNLKDTKGFTYYPHFGTFLWGFFWKNSLLQYEYSGRLIYIFVFLLSIFSVCDLIKNKNNLKIITIFVIVLICFDVFLFMGYQEVLIFSFLIFASKNLYYYLQEQKKVFLIIAFVCLNFVPWIKNEGYLFLIIFNLSMLFIIKQFKKKNEILFFALLSILMLTAKQLIFLNFQDSNMLHEGKFYLPNLIEILFFIKSLFFGFVVAIMKYKIWLFIFYSFYIFYKKINFKGELKSLIKILQINLILFFILVVAIYISVIDHHYYDLHWWIDNSLDRIIYQISGLFIIMIPLLINNLKIKF